MGAVDIGWTDERVAQLRKLWRETGKSASEIARELGGGLNRNAVIGKVHRLGLEGRASANPLGRPKLGKPLPSPAGLSARGIVPKKQAAPRPDLPKAAQVIVPAPPAPKPAEPKAKPAPPLRVQLVDMTSGQCKWPEGDGPFTFCGHRRHADTPYCREHAAMAKASNGPMGGGSGESMARALRKFL